MNHMATNTSVWDLPRNDVGACVAYYEKYGVTMDEGAVMLQLQDDPKELQEVMIGWKVRGTATRQIGE